MRKGTTIVAGLVAAPLLLGTVTACNKDGDTKAPASKTAAADSGKDAKTRFLEASDRTADATKSRVTMRFDVTPESVVKLAGAMASSTSSASAKPMDTKVARLIATSKIVIDSQATGDKPLKDETDPAKTNGAITWKTDSDLVNVAMAHQDLFVKMDLAKIGEQTGAFTMDDVKRGMGQVPAWVQDAVDGKWVGMSKDTMTSLTKSAGADVDAGSLTPQQAQQLNAAARKQISANGTFTGDGDDISVQLRLKPFMTGFLADAKQIAPKQFTAETSKQMDEALAGLKADAVLKLDSTLSDGKIKTLKTDLGQVLGMVDETKIKDADDKKQLQDLKAKDISFPVVMEYSDLDQDVTAPAGARMVTQADLEQLTGGARSSAPLKP